MTIPIAVTLSLSFLALCGSICALVVALRSSGRSLSKRLNEHSQQLSDVALELEAVNTRFKLLNSRINAARASAAASEKASATTDSEADKDAWTRETNLRIARGEFRRR